MPPRPKQPSGIILIRCMRVVAFFHTMVQQKTYFRVPSYDERRVVVLKTVVFNIVCQLLLAYENHIKVQNRKITTAQDSSLSYRDSICARMRYKQNRFYN